MVGSITDKFGRPIRDLRISVTDRCNFRCRYCMQKESFGDEFEFMEREELLSFEELARIARIYADLGVKKLRMPCSDPLHRQDLQELIAELDSCPGNADIGMTTNGMLSKKHGQKLYDAALRRLNISLDAMDDQLFGVINDRGIGTSRIIEHI